LLIASHSEACEKAFEKAQQVADGLWSLADLPIAF
jgi:hypothetical protein